MTIGLIERDDARKVVIIYEATTSGVRAKCFADSLAEQFDVSLLPSLWRSDLFADPAVAGAATAAAADSDYIIISLRAHRALSGVLRRWVEGEIGGAARRGAGLIVLATPEDQTPRPDENVEMEVHGLCAAEEVPYFSHAVMTDFAPPPHLYHPA